MRHLTALGLTLSVVGFVLAPVTAAYAQGGFTDAGSVVHLTTAGDRVGIGTITPTAKLHVRGTVLIEGRFTTNTVTSAPGESLRLRIDGVNALRLQQTAGTPNIIGGFKLNEMSDGVEG